VILSLDAKNLSPSWGHAPPSICRISLPAWASSSEIGASASLRGAAIPALAEFEALWTVEEKLARPEPGSLDFCLIERYGSIPLDEADHWYTSRASP